MNPALLRTYLRKKPLYATEILQTLSRRRSFSSHKLRYGTQTKHLDKALRILDIISPKKSTAASSAQNHLRLIQDFLQTGSNQIAGHCISSDFTSSISEMRVSSSFEEVLESSVQTNEELDSKAVAFDASVLSNAVSLCGSARDLQGGSQYHCIAIRTGFVANAYVGSSLVTLYSRCGEMENAYKVFEEMPVRNVVSWTAIISGFAKEWQVDVCLQLYSVMRNSNLKPNDFTFTSILSACTGSGALGQGRSAHCQIIQMGFDSYLQIANALVSMYCKCGSVDDALYIFKSIVVKDIVSWNSMISGYAQHGLATQAIEIFEEMKKFGVKPDRITFLGVLSSCRHAGFVEVGRKYFNLMVEYGLCPELDHYSCLVDLLGRAGLIEEARDFIVSMPVSPNAVIWGSLLSSCRLHDRVWIGIQAAESRLLLDPCCAATHLQLANLYASVRCWDRAAKNRKFMKDWRLKTHPGYSWIEIKNIVYRFRAEESSNAKLNEILGVVDCLYDQMLTFSCKIQKEIYDTL